MNIDEYKLELDYLINNYKQKIHHSWIFHGPKGSGKSMFLDYFFKKIYDKKNYAQFVYEINGDENLALIDDVRKIINQSFLTNSINNSKTFLVIKNLELLNINSKNALLKTIEEPPNNTILILITHNFKLIPKTIKSRCIKIKFNPYKSIIYKNIKKDTYEENFKIGNGQPQVIKDLVSEDGKFVKNELINLLQKKELDFLEFEKLYTRISKSYDQFFPIIINTIFYILKNKFRKNLQNLNINRLIIVYLDFLNNNFKKKFQLDKKKSLHLILSEYFYLGLNK
jgi:DNA polymerase-3 subunit delta'